MPKRREWLEERRAFHEGQIAETADDLQVGYLIAGAAGGSAAALAYVRASSCPNIGEWEATPSTLPMGGSHWRFKRYVGQTRNDHCHSNNRIQGPTVCGDSRVAR
jgi:hypothetical protein